MAKVLNSFKQYDYCTIQLRASRTDNLSVSHKSKYLLIRASGSVWNRGISYNIQPTEFKCHDIHLAKIICSKLIIACTFLIFSINVNFYVN